MILIIFILILFIYAVLENTLMLKTRTEIFNNNTDKIKILHLSDLHKRSFGKYNIKLIEKVRSLNPDIIIFSGDLISRDTEDLTGLEKFIENLVKTAPVYFSMGNHELDLKITNNQKYKEFIEILKKYNVHILKNASENFTYKNRKISITGASLKNTVYKTNNGYKNIEKYSPEDISNDLGTPEYDCLNILIAHNPFFAETYSYWNADYTLSGHVHGGAVRIPFFNIPLLSPERKFFPEYSKGVFEIGNMKLLVSGGLGKFRLFNPPEIVVYYI
ncbi:MAG: metallophosphoesterase [Oscillospiraceae bacterium]|nr:metallophosphoesterase [Oscillospiraceae bacterium]